MNHSRNQGSPLNVYADQILSMRLKSDVNLLNLRDSFKVTCRDNGKDDPPWKEWRNDGSSLVIKTTFSITMMQARLRIS